MHGLVLPALRQDPQRDGRARLELRRDARQVVDGERRMAVQRLDHVARHEPRFRRRTSRGDALDVDA